MFSSSSRSEIQVECFRYDIISAIKQKCKGRHQSVSEVFQGTSTDVFIVGQIITEKYGSIPLKLRKFILLEVHPNGDTGENFVVFFFEKKHRLQVEIEDYVVIHNPWISKSNFINHFNYINVQYTSHIIVGKERKVKNDQEKDNREYLQILRAQPEINEEIQGEKEVTSHSAVSKTLGEIGVQTDELDQSSLADKSAEKILCTPTSKTTCDDLSHRIVEGTTNPGKASNSQDPIEERLKSDGHHSQKKDNVENEFTTCPDAQTSSEKSDVLIDDCGIPSTFDELQFSSKKTNSEQSRSIEGNQQNEEEMLDTSASSLNISNLQDIAQLDKSEDGDCTSIDTDLDGEWSFKLEMSETPTYYSLELDNSKYEDCTSIDTDLDDNTDEEI